MLYRFTEPRVSLARPAAAALVAPRHSDCVRPHPQTRGFKPLGDFWISSTRSGIGLGLTLTEPSMIGADRSADASR